MIFANVTRIKTYVTSFCQKSMETKIWGNCTKRPCMCPAPGLGLSIGSYWDESCLSCQAAVRWKQGRGEISPQNPRVTQPNLGFWLIFLICLSSQRLKRWKHRGVIMAWHDTHSVDSLWCAKGCLLDARREKPLEDVKQAILKVKPDIEVRSLLSVTGKNLPSFSRSQVDVFQQDLSQLNASRFSEMLEGRDVATLALWKDLWSIKDQIKCMEE